MPKKKLLITIAVSLIIIGGIGSMVTFQSVFASEPVSKEESFDEQDILNINIESDNSRVEILPTKETTTKVEFTAAEKKNKKYNFQADVENGSLNIVLKEKRFFKFFSFDFSFSGPTLKVYVPEKQYEALNIDVINGKINVEDLHVNLATIETVNGAIQLRDMETNATKVNSENGKVSLRHVRGEIIGEVTNGSISLVVDHLDRPIDLESVNGKLRIETEQEPTNATIDVDVVNGKVDIFGNDSRHTVIGDGENLIKLETVNGSIKVSK
ncbi:DUF4097 domain-containing protein [Ornithinibacillus salinisoli]|uniref:DUF4097 domain-containing protein n=1 Tax=Ornithinibacillus salinisoli TaxID=1848459 RepID=A0ABW4VVP0_9BACI